MKVYVVRDEDSVYGVRTDEDSAELLAEFFEAWVDEHDTDSGKEIEQLVRDGLSYWWVEANRKGNIRAGRQNSIPGDGYDRFHSQYLGLGYGIFLAKNKEEAVEKARAERARLIEAGKWGKV